MFLCHSREKAGTADVHPVPDPRAREGVPLQPIPDAEEKDRDCARAVPHRKTDQDLVPESAHEVEEREQDQRRTRLRRRARQHEPANLAAVKA